MHLILTGATGLVGSACLQVMLADTSITTISILSRRPVPQAQGHEKAKVIIHKDYTSYPSEILDQLKGAKGVVWAQGISQNDVSKSEYIKITEDYPLAAAKAFASLPISNPFNFVYVSGEGATTTPGRFTPLFGQIKGRTEAALLDLSKTTLHPTLRPFSVRPGGVDPKFHIEIHDYVRDKQKAYQPPVLTVLRTLYPGGVSPTRELAKVLVDLAKGDGEPLSGDGISGEGRTANNKALRRMAGL